MKPLLALIVLVPAAWCQEKPVLKARELFYTPSADVVKTPPPAKAAAPKAAPKAKQTVPAAPVTVPAAADTAKIAAPEAETKTASTEQVSPPAPVLSPANDAAPTTSVQISAPASPEVDAAATKIATLGGPVQRENAGDQVEAGIAKRHQYRNHAHHGGNRSQRPDGAVRGQGFGVQ